MEQSLVLKKYKEGRNSIGVSLEACIIIAIALCNSKGRTSKDLICKWRGCFTEEPT